MSGARTAALFFWHDWQADPCLRLCGFAAQGVWMRLLCIAAETGGYVTIGRPDRPNRLGSPPSSEDLAKVIGGTPAEIETAIAELELHGVFSRTRGRVIYSRRMIRGAKSATNGQKGGRRPSPDNRQIIASKSPDNRQQGGDSSPSETKEKSGLVSPLAREPIAHSPYLEEESPPAPPSPSPGGAEPALAFVAAFDRVRTEIYGAAQARPWPAPMDLPTARRWLNKGADLALVENALRGAIGKYHLDGAPPPRSLKGVELSIADALRARTAPMPEGRLNGYHATERDPAKRPGYESPAQQSQRMAREKAR